MEENNLSGSDNINLPTSNTQKSELKQGTSVLSIIALISGILSVIPCCFHVYLCAPLAIILGLIELYKIKKGESSTKGKTLAIVAIALGGFSLIIIIIFLILGVSMNLLEKKYT